jgi:hypothetical protein
VSSLLVNSSSVRAMGYMLAVKTPIISANVETEASAPDQLTFALPGRSAVIYSPPNGWPLSCGRAKSYHAGVGAKSPGCLKLAAGSFSGLLSSDPPTSRRRTSSRYGPRSSLSARVRGGLRRAT